MPAAARILDANANRAREALRVLEDAARFALDDARLSAQLKSLRHDLREALAGLAPGWLEANRDTAGDVGTAIEAPAESERGGLADVAVAAGKRLGEALRVIEEVGKTIDPGLARDVEAIRYRFYDVEGALHLRLGGARARQWRVCVLLTEALCRRPWPEVLAAVVEAGADCVQVREKKMAAADLVRRARQVIEVARPAGAGVIVNDRVDVAQAADADGVHLGQEDLSVVDARRAVGRSLLIGASTHDPDEARAAVEAGADYCGVGQMFPTTTRPGTTPAGPPYLRAFLERFPATPHLAIGGITPDNIGLLVDAGVKGVAVSSAVCGAEDPGRVVRALREALESVPGGKGKHPLALGS
ncbi:MAG: thiamine phosphate synthase [Planctomycetota bacterium]|jgi:thiamine-phosphate pyrophosphorylase